MSIVIEAEFVEVGKHQKVVTYIDSLAKDKAQDLFATWLCTFAYPNFSDNKAKSKTIRNQLRSFGWYIVRTNQGKHRLMEEETSQIWIGTLNGGWLDPLTRKFMKDNDIYPVWVPSLQKRLIMRSVA